MNNPTSNQRILHICGTPCLICENERLRAAMGEAYALLPYAAPDSELVDDEPKWVAECDAWLDKFAPSKLAVLSGDSSAPALETKAAANTALTCGGACRYEGDGTFLFDLNCSTHGFTQKAPVERCDVCENTEGRHYSDCILVVPRRDKGPHSTESDFQHWLSYSGNRYWEVLLRAAYYAGADVTPPQNGKGDV